MLFKTLQNQSVKVCLYLSRFLNGEIRMNKLSSPFRVLLSYLSEKCFSKFTCRPYIFFYRKLSCRLFIIDFNSIKESWFNTITVDINLLTADINLLIVNNRNIRTSSEKRSNFEHISHHVVVFLLLNLSR